MDDAKLRIPGTSLHTESLGALVVHRISPGAMLRLAQAHPGLEDTDDLDPKEVADSILREVCRVQRVDGPAYSERELTPDEVAGLAPRERVAIVRAVCEAEGWDPAGPDPDESLVRGVQSEASAEQERERASSDTRYSVTAADGALSPETTAKLAQSAARLEAVKASLQLPDWLDQMKARQRLYDPQPLPSHAVLSSRPDALFANGNADVTSARLLAASELQGRKLDGLAEAQRLALQSQTDVNETLLAIAQELSVRAKGAEQQAKTAFRAAVAMAALLALAALAQIVLLVRSMEANEALQTQWERQIEEEQAQLKALREQSDALREQGERDSAALREFLHRGTPAALATAVTAAPPAAAAKSAKPTAPAKRAPKASR